MGTRPPRRRSRTFSSLTTDHSWSLTPGGTNPRSSAVLAPERVTRNLIVKIFYSIVFGESKIAFLSFLRPLGTLKTPTLSLSLSLSSAFCTQENIRFTFVFLYNAVHHYHLYYVFLKEMKNSLSI